MTPKFENKPALTVVGLPYLGKNENNEIAAMWGDFNARSGEIQNFTGKCAYGACFAEPEGAAEGENPDRGSASWAASGWRGLESPGSPNSRALPGVPSAPSSGGGWGCGRCPIPDSCCPS